MKGYYYYATTFATHSTTSTICSIHSYENKNNQKQHTYATFLEVIFKFNDSLFLQFICICWGPGMQIHSRAILSLSCWSYLKKLDYYSHKLLVLNAGRGSRARYPIKYDSLSYQNVSLWMHPLCRISLLDYLYMQKITIVLFFISCSVIFPFVCIKDRQFLTHYIYFATS